MKKDSIFRNSLFHFFLRLLVALTFALFTAYQVRLAVVLPASRSGRLILISYFALITLASFFALSSNIVLRVISSVFLIGGILANTITKLTNVPYYFGNLNPNFFGTYLNCAVFVTTEVASVLLVFGYIWLLTNRKSNAKRIVPRTILGITAVLYFFCLILENILLLKYGMNIDTSLKATLLSRYLYYISFIGTAIIYMLPASKITEKEETVNVVYSNSNDEEIDLIFKS